MIEEGPFASTDAMLSAANLTKLKLDKGGRARMRTPLPALVLAVTTLLIAGCGGTSSKTSSTSTTTGATGATSTDSLATTATNTTSTASTSSVGSGKPLPAPRLIARADAICLRLTNELVAAKDKIRTLSDVARVAPLRASLEQTALEELSKLTPSGSIAKAYEELLAARKKLVQETVKLGEYAVAKNLQADTTLLRSSVVSLRGMEATAHQGGFKRCGRLS